MDGNHVILWRMKNKLIGLSTDWQVIPNDALTQLHNNEDLERWRGALLESEGDDLQFLILEGKLEEEDD